MSALSDDKLDTGRRAFADAYAIVAAHSGLAPDDPHAGELVDAIASALERVTRERDEAGGLAERLKLEAQVHATEARGANATIYEIYQVLSGGTGEPGNWHGAEPARAYVAAAEAQLTELQAAVTLEREACAQVVDNHRPDASFDDSSAGYIERDALFKNIAAAIRARTPAHGE